VLDLSGNFVTDSCLNAISELVGVELIGRHITKLELRELVLLHLIQFDKQLDLVKIIPKLCRVAPYKEPLVIKISHYQANSSRVTEKELSDMMMVQSGNICLQLI